MATNAAQFSRNVRKRGRQVVNSASRAVRRAGRAFLKTAVLSTPVDTGKARSNWRVGIGGRPTAVIEPYVPYPKNSKANGQGAGERANASAAISAGNARIATLKGVPSAGLKTSLTIVNNTPYLQYNGGDGIFERAIQPARGAIKGVRLLTDGS